LSKFYLAKIEIRTKITKDKYSENKSHK